MDASKPQIRIELIKKADAAFIDQLNGLLDEGMEWDSQEGMKFLKDSNNALFVAFFGKSSRWILDSQSPPAF